MLVQSGFSRLIAVEEEAMLTFSQMNNCYLTVLYSIVKVALITLFLEESVPLLR